MESDRKVKLRKSSNDVMLPNCFVISGYPICMPCDAKGIPLKDPIVVMAPQSPDWKPLHMFNQVSATRYMCLECKDHLRTLVPGKDTNAIEHMKSMHYSKLPIDWWSEQQIELERKSWENRKAQSKLVQSTIGTPNTKKNADLVKAWTKAIVLDDLPLSIERNDGIAFIMRFYNNDVQPKGY